MIVVFFTGNHITPRPTDTIVKWSEDRKLNYDNFVGEHFSHIDSSTKYDTLAVVDCFIKYEIKAVSGKIAIHAYACMRPRTSWMKVKAPGVFLSGLLSNCLLTIVNFGDLCPVRQRHMAV